MTRRRKVFFISLAVFIASFFLPAVRIPYEHLHGYECALYTIIMPWQKDGLLNLSARPVEYVAFLLSGIINPLFVTAVVLFQKGYWVGKLLRMVVIGLFPSCWIFFWPGEFRPSVGYFLWTAAMLVALFAVSPKRQADSVQTRKYRARKTERSFGFHNVHASGSN